MTIQMTGVAATATDELDAMARRHDVAMTATNGDFGTVGRCAIVDSLGDVVTLIALVRQLRADGPDGTAFRVPECVHARAEREGRGRALAVLHKIDATQGYASEWNDIDGSRHAERVVPVKELRAALAADPVATSGLSDVEARAYDALAHGGRVLAGAADCDGASEYTYPRSVLQALVDAGLAAWRTTQIGHHVYEVAIPR